jgi:hypothetical protein
MESILQKTAALTFLLLSFSPSIAAGQPEASPDSSLSDQGEFKKVSPAEIRQLVEQLDANRFVDREAAGKQLEDIGQPAIDPLVVAAMRGSLELEQRAMQVLERFYRSANESLCDAAKVALEKLSTSSRERIARRATEILKFPPYGLQPGNWLGKGLVHGLGGVRPIKLGGAGGIVIGGGEVRLGNGAQIVVSGVEDDVRFVDIIQGSGLGVLIIENEKSGSIEVHTCQQRSTGTATYKRYQAKTAEQLRVANPNIHAFFEKFKGYRGGMVMNGAVAIQ